MVGCSFCLFLAAFGAAGTGSESTLKGWVNQLGKAGKVARAIHVSPTASGEDRSGKRDRPDANATPRRGMIPIRTRV